VSAEQVADPTAPFRARDLPIAAFEQLLVKQVDGDNAGDDRKRSGSDCGAIEAAPECQPEEQEGDGDGGVMRP
jgi:hypothetical protein